ncbi:alpha/beta hydrolase [Sphingobium sp. EM0848]|uniref:alpha/beta hydrolase n=1 Tax=Sphingobium sp. EM0848 TaxID=2743473 RepID=UPI00159C9A5D|nr:alpha/beta hydrolase [Sphingobium sp. EM0848]
MTKNRLRILPLLALIGAAPPPIQFEIGRLRPEPWPQTATRFPGGVTAQADIIYSQPLHYRPLRLDLYRPQNRKEPLPLIVHVHGGAWMTGTKRHGGPIRDFPAVLAQYAARGFVVASVEYRLDGEAHFPAAIQDVKTAIRFLRLHAGGYGIDPAHVGIFGGSAGGQLAALASTSCGIAKLQPPADPNTPDLAAMSDCVQAGVSWYGVHDFATVPTPPGQTGPAPYLGCPDQCSGEVLRFASPITYVDAQDPPMLLIHGLADTLVAVSQTQEFKSALKAAHTPVDAIYIPGVDHGFVGKTDADTHRANAQALEATLAFFERTLRPR